MLSEIPVFVINGDRDRMQHFQTYKKKKKAGKDLPFGDMGEDDECDPDLQYHQPTCDENEKDLEFDRRF